MVNKARIVKQNKRLEAYKIALKEGRKPKYSTRLRNRCAITGRPRGYIRKFGVSRIILREMIRNGEVPGVTKASW
jgi:small subunit ribosomal protein S14